MTDDLRQAVQQRTPADSAAAADGYVSAVFETLGERITDGAARDLAEQLPDDAATALERGADAVGEAEQFGLEDFLARVADRAGVAEARAREATRAVFDALEEYPTDAPFREAREQLPREFDVVAEPGERLATDEFLAAVEEAGGIGDFARARELTTSTLRTLGERVSRGEAEDVGTYLTPDLRESLVEAAPETPPDFDFGEFRERVADRAGVDEAAAEAGARAVVTALAETVATEELDKLRSQLPSGYGPLFEDLDAGP